MCVLLKGKVRGVFAVEKHLRWFFGREKWGRLPVCLRRKCWRCLSQSTKRIFFDEIHQPESSKSKYNKEKTSGYLNSAWSSLKHTIIPTYWWSWADSAIVCMHTVYIKVFWKRLGRHFCCHVLAPGTPFQTSGCAPAEPDGKARHGNRSIEDYVLKCRSDRSPEMLQQSWKLLTTRRGRLTPLILGVTDILCYRHKMLHTFRNSSNTSNRSSDELGQHKSLQVKNVLSVYNSCRAVVETFSFRASDEGSCFQNFHFLKWN